MTAVMMARFMPQTSSVCSRASASKGQLRSTTVPAGALWLRTRSPSAPGTCRREAARGLVEGLLLLGLRLRCCGPQPAAAAFKASAGVVPCAAASSMAAGQQLSREVVSTFRQDHRQLSAGSGVQLGGTAGAGASTLGEPLEADV